MRGPRRSGSAQGQALLPLHPVARLHLVVSAAVLCVLCSAPAATGVHVADINLAAPEIISVASAEAGRPLILHTFAADSLEHHEEGR